MTGPVQVLVVGFDEPSFSGEAVAELTRLREAGIVRLVDVVLVSRADDGGLVTLPPPPGADSALGELTTALLGVADDQDAHAGEGGPPTEGEWWSLDDAVPEGGCAAVALIEHTWAGPLVDAIRRAGGRLLDETWLARGDVDRLERLEANAHE
jgi:hypothetical protein